MRGTRECVDNFIEQAAKPRFQWRTVSHEGKEITLPRDILLTANEIMSEADEESHLKAIFAAYDKERGQRTTEELVAMLETDIWDLLVVYSRAETERRLPGQNNYGQIARVMESMIISLVCRAHGIGIRLTDSFLKRCEVNLPFGCTTFVDFVRKTYKPTAPEPQQAPRPIKDLLPEKLKVNEAVKVFQRAIDDGLIANSPEGLKWNDTKQLLAYFATKISEKFGLTTRLDKDENKTTDWKTFETLFNVRGLKGAKQNWMRLHTHFEPTGFEKIDALF